MDFLQSIDWLQLLKCFIVGGGICIIGQILIDKTKLTPARILVIFVTTGAILGGLGLYKYVVDFAGAGATVPLTGFGYNLAKGLWIYSFSCFKAKNEKAIKKRYQSLFFIAFHF